MEMKVCKTCGKTKSVESFHKHKPNADGRNNSCAICVNNKNRAYNKVEKEYTTDMRIGNPSLKDYCMMYNFLASIGYEPKGDIHQQFCDRYGLVYKERPKRSENKYTYGGCS